MATAKTTAGVTNEYTTAQIYTMKNKKGETIATVRALSDQDAQYQSGVAGEFNLTNNVLSTKVDTNETKVK